MKRWTTLAAALAFVVGTAAPSFGVVTAWKLIWENPGVNCTIGRSVANGPNQTVGSTVRSKVVYCTESAADANLPADRMGVYAEGYAGFTLCASSGGWVYNAASTASKSVTTAVYCHKTMVSGIGWQTRKINSTDWADGYEATEEDYFP